MPKNNNNLKFLSLFSLAAYFVLHITNQFYSSEDLISIGFYRSIEIYKNL